MTQGLKRYYGNRDLHYITFSCYRRLPLLGTPDARDTFLRIFEQVRKKHRFEVDAFVVMPEHVHRLIGEPRFGNISTVMLVLKQRTAKSLLVKRERNKSSKE